MSRFVTWFKGIAQLRSAAVVHLLGEVREKQRKIDAIQSRQPTVRVSPQVELIGFDNERLLLEPHVSISAGTILCFGDEMNGFGAIRVGAATWIGQYNNIRAGGGDVTIGSQCLISQFCTLIASNHGLRRDEAICQQAPDSERRGVTLEDDVWLGVGVVITAGVTVHRGAVVGANAVVTSDIPEYEIWAGVPARKIGERA